MIGVKAEALVAGVFWLINAQNVYKSSLAETNTYRDQNMLSFWLRIFSFGLVKFSKFHKYSVCAYGIESETTGQITMKFSENVQIDLEFGGDRIKVKSKNYQQSVIA